MNDSFARRSLLASAGSGVLAALAGCGAVTPGSGCSLTNRIQRERTGTASEDARVNAFADLSERAQDVFLKTLESDEPYQFSDRGTAPDEFTYTDQLAHQQVRYEGEVYVLVTNTNAGCVVEDRRPVTHRTADARTAVRGALGASVVLGAHRVRLALSRS